MGKMQREEEFGGSMLAAAIECSVLFPVWRRFHLPLPLLPLQLMEYTWREIAESAAAFSFDEPFIFKV